MTTALRSTTIPSPTAAPRLGLIAATALAPMLWGTTYYVMTEFIGGHAFFAALIRSLPAGLVALAISRERIPDGWFRRLVALSLCNIGVFFPLLLVSAARLPGGIAASLGGTQPLVVAGLGALIWRERASRRRLAWGAVGAVGVGLVVLSSSATLDAIGIAAGGLGVVSMGTGIVLMRRWGRPAGLSPFGFAGWQLTLGGLVLAPVALAVDGVPIHLDGRAIGGLIWLGLVGGLLTYTLWFRGSAALPPASSSVLLLLSPLVAAIVGVVALGESVSALQGIGFVAALSALVASQRVARLEAVAPPG